MKKTPLAEIHPLQGAKMVEFGGWWMPVQYRPILDEVRTVRTACGLFDLSHMGRVAFRGEDAIAFSERLATNRIGNMKIGQIRYSLFCGEDGNCIDDVLAYRTGEDSVLFVINAGNTPKDLNWIREQSAGFAVEIQDQTDEIGMIALQGPRSESILSRLTDIPLSSLRYYFFSRGKVCGVPNIMVSRTGYTGEDGFEVYLENRHMADCWNALLEAGRDMGIRPIGLGARDILRLEAGMPLYGHEIDEKTNPLEAGLGWAVKFEEGKDFIGKTALEKWKATGSKKKLVGFRTDSKRVPRQGYPIVEDGREVGSICSGAISPTLETNIATGYVPAEKAVEGSKSFSMKIRDAEHPLELTSLPFHKRNQ